MPVIPIFYHRCDPSIERFGGFKAGFFSKTACTEASSTRLLRSVHMRCHRWLRCRCWCRFRMKTMNQRWAGNQISRFDSRCQKKFIQMSNNAVASGMLGEGGNGTHDEVKTTVDVPRGAARIGCICICASIYHSWECCSSPPPCFPLYVVMGGAR